MQKPKRHHLVPAVYLKPWCYSGDSIFILEKESKKIENKNIYNNFTKTNYHSITVGSPICTEDDLAKIFECLSDYSIYYDGNRLNTFIEYYNNYKFFDNWELSKDGLKMGKKEKNLLKKRMDEVKVTEIEELWNEKFENKLPKIRAFIEDKIMSANQSLIPAMYKGFMMKFIVSMNWRGFLGNDSLNEVYESISKIFELEEISTPKDLREKSYLDTADKEMKHWLVLKKYREFLNSGKGSIFDIVSDYMKMGNIKFLISDEKNLFITSDNPSFVSKWKEGYVHIMALTPRIVILVGKESGDDDHYYVKSVNAKMVKEINQKIFENSFQRIIGFDKKSFLSIKH